MLANRIDSMNIHYFDQKVTYTAPPGGSDITNWSDDEVTPANAKYIVIAISVTLDQIGTPGSPRLPAALLSFTLLRCHTA